MSQKSIVRTTTAARDRRFQMDLQQHTRRMGWGVPMKPIKNKDGTSNDDDQSSVGARSMNHKKMKSNRPKMPTLHRASSSNHHNLSHPNHGTLDESAGNAKVTDNDPTDQNGDKWWAAEFSDGLADLQGPAAPLPPTGSNLVAEMVEAGMSDDDLLIGMDVNFNKSMPLPGISSQDTDPSSNDGNNGDPPEFFSALDVLDQQLQQKGQQPDSLDTPSAAGATADAYDPTLVASPSSLVSPDHESSANTPAFKLEQMVDAALFASWRSLPWQSRVCPRTLEERESVRLLASLVQERRRMGSWVIGQNRLAMSSAQTEDLRFSKWVREERARVREEEETEVKRVQAFEQAESVRAKIFEVTERERVEKEVEAKERSRVCLGTFIACHKILQYARQIYVGDSLSQEAVDAEKARQSLLAIEENGRVSSHISTEQARASSIFETERERVFEAEMRQAHKTNGLWAAAIARSTNISNQEDEDAFRSWGDEVARVDSADVEETERVQSWETLQTAIMKAARANVLRLLAPDTAVVDYEDEMDRSKYYCGAFKSRSREEKSKFTKQRYLAAKEAGATRRKWKNALAKWRESTLTVHEKRRAHEKDRIMANLSQETDRVTKRVKQEADRVSFAWDRECQRVQRWRETEQSYVNDLLAEWARGSDDGDRAFKQVAQKAFDELEGGRNKVLARKLQNDFFANELTTQLNLQLAKEAERVESREKTENENVSEFESAQLLMVMGVSEQLTKIASNLYLAFTKEIVEGNIKTSPDVMSSDVSNFAKQERGRIGVSYRIETERVAKACVEEERVVTAEVARLTEFASDEYAKESGNVKEWRKVLFVWSDELHAALLAGNTTWFEDQQKTMTNELLRIWGSDVFKQGLELPEPPNPESEENADLLVQYSALNSMAHGESAEDRVIRRNAGAVEESEKKSSNNKKKGKKAAAAKETKLVVVTKTRTVTKQVEVPQPTGDDGIGKQISVYWPEEEEWFGGVVDDFSDDAGGWHVTYEDGDEEWIENDSAAMNKDWKWVDLGFVEQEVEEQYEVEEEVEVDVEDDEHGEDDYGEDAYDDEEEQVSGDAAAAAAATTAHENIFECDEIQLNAWRCKSTILMLEARLEILNKEVARQGVIRSDVLQDLVEQLVKSMEAKHAECLSNFNQVCVLERTRVLERNTNESARVSNRQAMELKSWEQFVTAIELMTRNNFSYSENIVNQLLSWQTTAFANVKEGHIKNLRKLLKEDEKQAIDGSTYRYQDFKVLHGSNVSAIAAQGSEYMGLLDSVWISFEGSVSKKEKALADFGAGLATDLKSKADAAIANSKELCDSLSLIVESSSGGSLEDLRGVADRLNASLGEFNNRELLASLEEAEKSILAMVEENAAAGKKQSELLAVDANELSAKLGAGVDGVGVMGELVGSIVVAAREKLAAEREKEQTRYAKCETLIKEKLEVLEREVRFEGNKKVNSQKMLFEKHDEARNMLLKEDCDGFDAGAEEFKQSVVSVVGNSNLEEQKKVIDRILFGRKECLEGVASLAKQTLLDELNRQNLLIVGWIEEHVGELRKLWSDYESSYEELKTEWEAQESTWLEKRDSELKTTGEYQAKKFEENVEKKVAEGSALAEQLSTVDEKRLGLAVIRGVKDNISKCEEDFKAGIKGLQQKISDAVAAEESNMSAARERAQTEEKERLEAAQRAAQEQAAAAAAAPPAEP
jgi:hypothetical protein